MKVIAAAGIALAAAQDYPPNYPHAPHPRLHNRTLCELQSAEGFLGQVLCSNWAGNIEWTPSQIIAPHNEEELVKVVKNAYATDQKLKVVGLGHSWSPIHTPDAGGATLTLSHLTQTEIDLESMTVKVGAGLTFKALHERLAEEGLALAWMSGGIMTLTIGGAVSVGYHGSQIGVGTISSLTQHIKVLKSNGEWMDTTTPDAHDKLRAVRTGLGLVGIVTEVTLPITQQFYLKRARWEVPTMAEFVKNHLPVWRSHPRFHWYWHPYTDKVWGMTWEPTTKEESDAANLECRTAVKQYQDAADTRFGVDGMPLVLRWDNCSGPSYIAYTHADDMRAQPIWNKEYFVPVAKEMEALHAFVNAMKPENNPNPIHPDFWVHERYLTADDSFLMPCYGMGQCSSFEVALVSESMTGPLPSEELWRQQTDTYDRVMQTFHGRPHWAKENLVDYDYYIESGAPIDEFMKIRKEMDPTDMFMVDYLREKLEPPAYRKLAETEKDATAGQCEGKNSS